MDSKFLKFVQQESSGLTKRFGVETKADNPLGAIIFYPQWRKYVFQPTKADFLIFDEGCLKDITFFLERLNLARKVDQQNKRTNKL